MPQEQKVRIRGAIPKSIKALVLSDALELELSLEGVIGVAITNFFLLAREKRVRCYKHLPKKFGRPLE